MPVTMKGVIRWPLLLCLVLFLLFCGGCGYFYYTAYYIPYEAYQARSDFSARQLMTHDAQMQKTQEGLGNFEVEVGLIPKSMNVDNCFLAEVWLKRDSCMSDLGSLLAKTRPVGDSAVIVSEDNGYLGTLILTTQKHSGIYWSFESDSSLCIGRRDDKLAVTFFVQLIGTDGNVVESKRFDVRLHRWEKRYWLW